MPSFFEYNHELISSPATLSWEMDSHEELEHYQKLVDYDNSNLKIEHEPGHMMYLRFAKNLQLLHSDMESANKNRFVKEIWDKIDLMRFLFSTSEKVDSMLEDSDELRKYAEFMLYTSLPSVISHDCLFRFDETYMHKESELHFKINRHSIRWTLNEALDDGLRIVMMIIDLDNETVSIFEDFNDIQRSSKRLITIDSMRIIRLFLNLFRNRTISLDRNKINTEVFDNIFKHIS